MAKQIHNLAFYLILIAVGGVLLTAIQFEPDRNLDVPIIGLIVQILLILIFSRICGALLKKIGQPSVIGEMIAGILLGKSVFGYFWPDGFQTVFPETSMSHLYFLSQVGLIFFMFGVGLKLKVSELKNRAAATIFISHSSILAPFVLGALAAVGLYSSYGPQDHSLISFALFMGIAMSITAFPVLARILEEKKMTDTPLGVMALTCAAVDDVTAWCVLAAVVGIIKAGTMVSAIAILAATMIYVLAMWKIIRPWVEKALQPTTVEGLLSRVQLGSLFGVLFASTYAAEVIGIHALFGAFLAGVIMPRDILQRTNLVSKIERATAVILLPLFFAYTGIRTQIGLVNSGRAWLVCAGIVILAVLGKLVGSAIAARFTGMNWRESLALGSLMNTRGLMELVILNIGYDLGILSPTLFAMMVMMAIVTTLMTSPLLKWLVPKEIR